MVDEYEMCLEAEAQLEVEEAAEEATEEAEEEGEGAAGAARCPLVGLVSGR